MDIVGHALYGATLCSRTGLAGGRRGARGVRGRWDWTLWAAIGFSLMPDLASIGISFAQMIIRGGAPSFHAIPPYVYMLYNVTHSMLVACLFVLVVRLVARPLFVPALAWPLHVFLDIFLHGTGRWQTPVLWPLSDWHINGVNWWQYYWVPLTYWGILPMLWLALHMGRRSAKRSDSALD